MKRSNIVSSLALFSIVHLILLPQSSSMFAQPPGFVKWAFPTENTIRSSPAIGMDGTIYVTSAGLGESNDAHLYAIHPDGTQKWRITIGRNGIGPTSPAIGTDGTIYIGGGYHEGGDGRYFYAVNPDGTVKWSFPPVSDHASFGSPVVSNDGTIYVHSWLNGLYAIAPDGTKKWNFNTGLHSRPRPTIAADGTVYVCTSEISGPLIAINPDGTQKWQGLSDARNCGEPIIGSDGTIYVGADGSRFFAIYPDGTQKWDIRDIRVGTAPSIGPDGMLYFVSANQRNSVLAMTSCGITKWNSSNIGFNYGSQAAIGTDGTLYIGGNRKLHAINPNGTLKWGVPTGGKIESSPAISPDGTIYVGSRDGFLYAISSESGGLSNSSWPMFGRDLRHTRQNQAFIGDTTVIIDAPRHNTIFGFEGKINLMGTAVDDRGSDFPESALLWTSDKDGELGRGRHVVLNTSDLSEGFHAITFTASDASGEVVSSACTTIVRETPVSIKSPNDGANFNSGEPILFKGEAVNSDGESLPDSSLVWQSDTDGQIGTGQSFTRSNLSVGTHVITLTATNAQGAMVSESVTIRITTTGEDGRNGPWVGRWVQVNFLTNDDNGVWDADDESPEGIGFVATITKSEWIETDNFGEAGGCTITYDFSIDSNNRYLRVPTNVGESCGFTLDFLLSLHDIFDDTGMLEFSNGNNSMIDNYDFNPFDDDPDCCIVAFKYRRQ